MENRNDTIDLPDQTKFLQQIEEEIKEEKEKLSKEAIRKQKWLRMLSESNKPEHRIGTHLDPNKQYRVYTLSIKRKYKKEENLTFSTVALDSTEAINNLCSTFERTIADFDYVRPKTVSKPMYPKELNEFFKQKH